MAGATQPVAGAGAGEALADPAGATQPAGAEAVADAEALVGVACMLANRRCDGAPSAGSPFACWKAEIAARVFGPMKPSAVSLR